MTPFGKFKHLVVELGGLDALLYCLDRLGRAAGSRIGIVRYVLVAQPVREPSPAISGRGSTITVRPLETLAGLSNETTLTAETLAARRAGNSICFGALEGDQLVAFACLALGPHADEIVNVRFITMPPDKTAWDYDTFIVPRHRLGIVYAKLWSEMFAFLKRRGIDWTISYIASYNIRSRRSHSRMGALQVGSLIVVTLGRRQLIIDGGRLRVVFAGALRPRPEILVSAPAAKSRGL